MRFFIGLLAVVIGQSIDEQINVHFAQSGHTNNWAVLVCASRYWFNYRHIANTLSVYRSVKRLGIPDSQILLFLADDMACNGRNGEPGAVYNHRNKLLDLYGNDVEVDFRGEEVTVQNVIRLLTGRQDKDTPRSRRLNTDSKSNVLFYLTGHGGEDFLKFQDDEEISAYELVDAFEQMHQKRRYNELLFIIDTCQAESMIRNAYSPGFVGFASSRVGEDSLSHHVDVGLGVYMVDRFTFHLLEFLETVSPNSKKPLSDLKRVCPTSQCISTPVHKFNLLTRDRQKSAKVSDFFGSERKILYHEDAHDVKCDLTDLPGRSGPLTSSKPPFMTFEQSLAAIDTIEHERNKKSEQNGINLVHLVISILTIGSVTFSACL